MLKPVLCWTFQINPMSPKTRWSQRAEPTPGWGCFHLPETGISAFWGIIKSWFLHLLVCTLWADQSWMDWHANRDTGTNWKHWLSGFWYNMEPLKTWLIMFCKCSCLIFHDTFHLIPLSRDARAVIAPVAVVVVGKLSLSHHPASIEMQVLRCALLAKAHRWRMKGDLLLLPSRLLRWCSLHLRNIYA